MDLIVIGLGLLVVAIAMIGLFFGNSSNKTDLEQMIEDDAPDYILDDEYMRIDMANSRRDNV